MLINETIRLFSIDLRDYVEKLWDEDVPVIRHMVVEAVGVSEEMLGNSGVSKKMVGVCDKLGFHIIKTYKHLFTPQGISLVFILKESHLAIHTWPEKGYFHMDAVTCSKEDVKIMRLVEELVLQFKPRSTRVLRLKY